MNGRDSLNTKPHTEYFITFPFAYPPTLDAGKEDRTTQINRYIQVNFLFAAVHKAMASIVTGFEIRPDSICLHLDLSSHSRPLLTDRFDVSGAIRLTAHQLAENVDPGPPRPLVQALTTTAFLPLLRAVSRANPAVIAAPRYHGPDGEFDIPILSPQVFAEPLEVEDHSKTGTFGVQGFILTRKGELRYLLTLDRIEVEIPGDLGRELVSASILEFQNGLWIQGTMEKVGATWILLDDAILIRQTGI